MPQNPHNKSLVWLHMLLIPGSARQIRWICGFIYKETYFTWQILDQQKEFLQEESRKHWRNDTWSQPLTVHICANTAYIHPHTFVYTHTCNCKNHIAMATYLCFCWDKGISMFLADFTLYFIVTGYVLMSSDDSWPPTQVQHSLSINISNYGFFCSVHLLRCFWDLSNWLPPILFFDRVKDSDLA